MILAIDLLTTSHFTDSFKEAFSEDFISNWTVHNASGSGAKHALEFIVLGNKFRRDSMDMKKTKFIIGLTSSIDYFDLDAVSHTINAGR